MTSVVLVVLLAIGGSAAAFSFCLNLGDRDELWIATITACRDLSAVPLAELDPEFSPEDWARLLPKHPGVFVDLMVHRTTVFNVALESIDPETGRYRDPRPEILRTIRWKPTNTGARLVIYGDEIACADILNRELAIFVTNQCCCTGHDLGCGSRDGYLNQVSWIAPITVQRQLPAAASPNFALEPPGEKPPAAQR